MSKKKVMFSLAGFALGVALAVPAQADDNGDDNGKDKDCRGNWDRVRVNRAACEREARRVDRDGNDDNVVCEQRRYGVIKYRDNDRGKGNGY